MAARRKASRLATAEELRKLLGQDDQAINASTLGPMDPTVVLPVGVELVHRWSFRLDDLPESIGGGFSAGEFERVDGTEAKLDGLMLERFRQFVGQRRWLDLAPRVFATMNSP